MSLYRHVASKDELVRRMLDETLGSRRSIPRAADWRARLEQWCWDLLEGLRRHPWVIDVPISRPPWTHAQLVLARPRRSRRWPAPA